MQKEKSSVLWCDMKMFLYSALALVVVAGVGYLIVQNIQKNDEEYRATIQPLIPDTTKKPEKTSTTTPQSAEDTEQQNNEPTSVIGTSVEERDIVAYHFGTGEKEVLFVGGIHGGYEWNTALVAYELIEYLTKNPTAVPDGVRATVIPVLNPDGLTQIVGTSDSFTKTDVSGSQEEKVASRFNAHTVDLNRNFDCDWKAQGVWQSRTVSGGSKAFSEPESQALRDYVETHPITGAVVWYSSAGGVYASACDGTTLPESKTLTDLFARASGYPAHQSFDDYAVNGDAVNWLAKSGVPAISVLLTNHEDTEWSKNKAGIDAILSYYAQ